MCANTDVFLDGDFMSAFASLVCHHNHSMTPTVPIKSGKDVPQLTHVTFLNSVLAIKDCKQLPKGIQRIVAVMHTKLHYAVTEITVDTKTIKIFDLGAAAGMLVVLLLLPLSSAMGDGEFDRGGSGGGGCGGGGGGGDGDSSNNGIGGGGGGGGGWCV